MKGAKSRLVTVLKLKTITMAMIQFDIPDDLDLRLTTFVKRRNIAGEKTTKAKACLKLIAESLKYHE